MINGWLMFYDLERPPDGWEVVEKGGRKKGVHAKGLRVAKRVLDSLFIPAEHVLLPIAGDRNVNVKDLKRFYGEAKKLRECRVKLYRVEGKDVLHDGPTSYTCKQRRFVEAIDIEEGFEQFIFEALELGCEIADLRFEDDWSAAINDDTETGVAAKCLVEAARWARGLETAKTGHFIAWQVAWYVVAAAKRRATWPPGLTVDWELWKKARDITSGLLDDSLRSMV